VADKRLAYRIVETALREALGETTDLGEWENLPLHRLLTKEAVASRFLLSVLLQVQILTSKKFSADDYKGGRPMLHLRRSGSEFAEYVDDSMLEAKSYPEASKDIGHFSRDRVSMIERLVAVPYVEHRSLEWLPGQPASTAPTASEPTPPPPPGSAASAPHTQPQDITRILEALTIREPHPTRHVPASESPVEPSEPPASEVFRAGDRHIDTESTEYAERARALEAERQQKEWETLSAQAAERARVELPHPGGRHIDIEPSRTEEGGRAAEDARRQREWELTKTYGAPAAPAPTRPAPAAPASYAPAPKRKREFSLKDILFGAPLKTPSLGVPDATAVRVFYATDRLQLPKLTGGVQYSKQRSLMGSVHYGKCEVSIPASHKVGKLETPSILRLEFRPDPKKHIILTKTDSLEEEEFFTQVNASVSRSTTKDTFVFIHGYNVSFEDAARRTGQMAYDLDFVGAPVFYSWPSNGKVADYPKDETNITWSTPHFQRFLKLMSERSGAERIHIIAHSMGNRAVCDALRALSYANPYLTFSHVVLAAPDIDAETFQELAETLQLISGRITLYESSKDKALSASKRIHGNPRAGEPLLVIPGLDTIDASEIDTDFLGHSYFSSNWPLLSDIHAILSDDKPPAGRFGLKPMEHKDGRYYAFRK
jgi:esterase/lipase superfamily enzyme